MALTKHQRRSLAEIKEIAAIAKLDYPEIETYDPEARTAILGLMKDHIVRSDVISSYTLIDEFLIDVICNYYFKRKGQTYRQRWRTKRFRIFVHYIMDETYLLKKLAVVNAIRSVPKDVRAAVGRINDVRNDLAHSFFPQNRRRYYASGKKVTYDGIPLFSKDGLSRFQGDYDLAYKYLWKRVFGADWVDVDF